MTRPEPTITWKTQKVNMVNNGHTVQLGVIPGETSPGQMSFDVGGFRKTYTLVQCHFHWGSEHTIANLQQPLETHCVHTLDGSDSGQRYGVFGVFYEVGSTPNSFFAQFDGSLVPHDPSDERLLSKEVAENLSGRSPPRLRRASDEEAVAADFAEDVNFKLLSDPVNKELYWSYDGSFTTPPCTEAVDFYIFMEPLSLSERQLNLFKEAIGWSHAAGNFRPPQPLNSRSVYGCTLQPPPITNEPWYPYEASTWSDAVGLNSHRVCDGGSAQSPIDFQSCMVPQEQDSMSVMWATQGVALKNNGHTVQLDAKGDDTGKMKTHGNEYTLVQCHFHWGSEHTVAGKQYPFEVHCVHTQDGSFPEGQHYGVFGQFYEIGATNQWLSNFEEELPGRPTRRLGAADAGPADRVFNVFGDRMEKGAGRKLGAAATSSWTGPLDFQGLYGDNPLRHFWTYDGSFTTPPCTEAVDFYILMDPATLSRSQLDRFKAKIGQIAEGGNFRPPQKLGPRVVGGCQRFATLENLLGEHLRPQGVLPQAIKDTISGGISTALSKELDNERAGHMAILIVIITLAGLVLLVSMAMLAMLMKVMRMKSTTSGEGVSAQVMGNRR